jgi:hypothetical protein
LTHQILEKNVFQRDIFYHYPGGEMRMRRRRRRRRRKRRSHFYNLGFISGHPFYQFQQGKRGGHPGGIFDEWIYWRHMYAILNGGKHQESGIYPGKIKKRSK